jgi:hypothetical protein
MKAVTRLAQTPKNHQPAHRRPDDSERRIVHRSASYGFLLGESLFRLALVQILQQVTSILPVVRRFSRLMGPISDPAALSIVWRAALGVLVASTSMRPFISLSCSREHDRLKGGASVLYLVPSAAMHQPGRLRGHRHQGRWRGRLGRPPCEHAFALEIRGLETNPAGPAIPADPAALGRIDHR